MILEIVITGLSAFVRDTCEVDKSKTLNVLMLKGHAGMEHKPRLLIEAKYVDPTKVTKDWPTEVVSLADGTQMLVWDLEGSIVNIPKAPAIGIYEGHRKAKTKRGWDSDVADFGSHPKDNAPQDVSWIPDIDRVCRRDPGTIGIDKDAFDATKIPAYATARMMTLKVTDSASNEDNWLEAGIDVDDPHAKTQVFKFNDDYSQLLADSARLQMTIKKVDRVEVKLIDLTTKEERTITVRMAGGETVPISISNLPNQHIPYSPGDPIDHFSAYFELIKNPTNKVDCSVPAEPVGIHVQPVKCTLCITCGPPE